MVDDVITREDSDPVVLHVLTGNVAWHPKFWEYYQLSLNWREVLSEVNLVTLFGNTCDLHARRFLSSADLLMVFQWFQITVRDSECMLHLTGNYTIKGIPSIQHQLSTHWPDLGLDICPIVWERPSYLRYKAKS